MKIYLILTFILGLLAASCGRQRITDNHLIWEIDPTCAIKTDLRLFIDSISLIPLSTNDNSLVKKICSIDFVNDKFYINNNRTDIQVYDSNGVFLYGTEEHIGGGPNDYISALSCNILPNDTIEILDANACKLCYYSYPQGVTSFRLIPKGILPVFQHQWLNGDTCVFSEGSTKNPILKIYSKRKNRIIEEIEDPQKSQFVKTSGTLYKVDDKLYFSAPYPSNYLYLLDWNLNKELVLQLDFGKYNFSMEEIPEDMDMKSAADYFSTHDEYVYPYEKYISDDFLLCYFQYDNQLHVAYKNKKSGIDVVFKNESGARPQLMQPHHIQGNKLFYASEPGYLPYLVDTTLMSKTDIAKMEQISEMDNPIIIIYTMK